MIGVALIILGMSLSLIALLLIRSVRRLSISALSELLRTAKNYSTAPILQGLSLVGGIVLVIIGSKSRS